MPRGIMGAPPPLVTSLSQSTFTQPLAELMTKVIQGDA